MWDWADVVYTLPQGDHNKSVPSFEGGHGVVMSPAERERREQAAKAAERKRVVDTVEKAFGPMPGGAAGTPDAKNAKSEGAGGAHQAEGEDRDVEMVAGGNEEAEDLTEARLDWAVKATEKVFEAKEQHRVAFLKQTHAAARRRGAEAIYSETWQNLKTAQAVARSAAEVAEQTKKAVREAATAVEEVRCWSQHSTLFREWGSIFTGSCR